MEKIPSKLFLLATIGLIALSYSADAFAESEKIFSEDTTILDDTTIEDGNTWLVESGVTLTIESNVQLILDFEGTLINKGTISISPESELLNADGILSNTGLIENKGELTIQSSAMMHNKGTINNYNWFEDEGTLNNMDAGIINNNQGSVFAIGTTSPNHVDGVFNNDGLIENKGKVTIRINGIFNNTGVFINENNFENEGTLNNMDAGIINNDQVTEFSIAGEVGIINNDGLIENKGNLTIERGAILNNKGTLNNYNWFDNEGTLNNMDAGIIHNNHESDLAVAIPTPYFLPGSSISDDLIENKDGLIENKDGITIRISGYVKNEGIVNNDGLIENRGDFKHHNGLLRGESVIHIQPDSFDDEGALNDNSDSEVIAQEEEKEPFCFLFWCW